MIEVFCVMLCKEAVEGSSGCGGGAIIPMSSLLFPASYTYLFCISTSTLVYPEYFLIAVLKIHMCVRDSELLTRFFSLQEMDYYFSNQYK